MKERRKVFMSVRRWGTVGGGGGDDMSRREDKSE